MKRFVRPNRLSPGAATRYRLIRSQVERDLASLIKRHHDRDKAKHDNDHRKTTLPDEPQAAAGRDETSGE